MRWLRASLLRVIGAFVRRRRDRELAEEIESHLQLHVDDNLRAGMTPQEARRQAILKFGHVEAIKETYRDLRGLPWLDSLGRDLWAAARLLRRRPAFSLVVVTTLAMGIGANAAIFSVVDAILLRPLPYPEAERIVEIHGRSSQSFTRFGPDHFRVSPAELAESPAFDALALTATGTVNLAGTPSERVAAAAVTEQFFRVLRVEAVVGRPFDAGDLIDSRRLVVLGHALWQRRFGGDPRIIGASVRLNQRSYRVVGVMPPRVDYPGNADLWIPNGADSQITDRAFPVTLVARLADGITGDQARGVVNRMVAAATPGSLAVGSRGGSGWGDRRREAVDAIVSLRQALVGEVRSTFLLVASGALLVLLVASANAANLLLTRVASRSRELSVRRALGASRLQVGRQLFAEGVVLSLVAAVASLPAALWAIRSVRALVPAQLYGVQNIELNGRVFLGLAAISLIAAILSGVVPAFAAGGDRSAAALRGGFQATHELFWRRCRSGLVIVEIAVAVVLLAAALTLVGAVREALAVDLGVRGQDSLTFEVLLPREAYGTGEEAASFYERFAAALREVPEIVAFGATNQLPGAPDPLLPSKAVGVIGRPWEPLPEHRYAIELTATPGLFEALGIDLVAGRSFTGGDRQGSAPVAMVSEGFARALGVDGTELLGEHVDLGSAHTQRLVEIVGVVRDVRLGGPGGDFAIAASTRLSCRGRRNGTCAT